jgi:3-hydroxyacyl-[acyl-carrier-protein] dehydratase
MRFRLVDQILELEPGEKIVTSKALSLAEEYLADHFPRFPVMPGVLMLEAIVEAGAWLVRVSDEMAHSMVTLRQVQNLRLRSFVTPGERLIVTARFVHREPEYSELVAEGRIEDRIAVSGRVSVNHYNLAAARPDLASADEDLKHYFQQSLQLLYQSKELTPA